MVVKVEVMKCRLVIVVYGMEKDYCPDKRVSSRIRSGKKRMGKRCLV